MIQKKFIIAAFLTSTLLSGCDSNYYTDNEVVPSTSVNIMPVIMKAIDSKIPEINERGREDVFNLICRVAYGEIKPSSFKDEIIQAGLIQNESEHEEVFTQLMQGEDVAPYQAVCAAYMIVSIRTIPDVDQYVSHRKDAKGQSLMVANEEAVINLMPFRLAVARATTELYGKLAAELPEKKVQSIAMYNQKILRLFSQSAAGYLNTVKKYNQEEMGHHYQLILLQKGKFSFKSSTGYYMDVSPLGVNLFLYGTPWLGGGYVMGMMHSIDITIE
ncbi:conserved protein of unknown function (plasmid) [Enterobacter cancerogenus]|uniref:hypothetical protein n=1 Tax=Enterobacter cancerogenus TaxID=69218 RepID=UPI0019253B73|nr:hypothetical protein [Enterobacter cancerogenus]CAD5360634.1 conserved protein of unknown function [Enterobacter cancerogenus]